VSELLLTIPDEWWISSNKRYHYHDKAVRTKAIRTYAAVQSRNAHLTVPPQVHIAIYVGYPTKAKADPPNAWPTAKAAIDGIVDAGTLADDNSEIVYCHSFLRDPKKAPAKHHTLRFVLTDQALEF